MDTLDTFHKQPLEVFCEKCVLKNFVNFTGRYLCWSLFSIKLQALSLRFLISNMTIFLLKFQPKNKQAFLFFHQILLLNKFEGADFNYINVIFKYQSKNTQIIDFLYRIFFARNFSIRQI